jgi:hypothetical protein
MFLMYEKGHASHWVAMKPALSGLLMGQRPGGVSEGGVSISLRVTRYHSLFQNRLSKFAQCHTNQKQALGRMIDTDCELETLPT